MIVLKSAEVTETVISSYTRWTLPKNQIQAATSTTNPSKKHAPFELILRRKFSVRKLRLLIQPNVRCHQVVKTTFDILAVITYCDTNNDKLCNDCMHFVVVTDSCVEEEFQCNDGVCISADMKCDGPKDCIDGEDESKCGCRSQCLAKTIYQRVQKFDTG